MTNVISFVRAREERSDGARERLLAAKAIQLPQNPYIEDGTTTAVLLEFQWRQYDEFIDAFEIDPTRDVPVEHLVALCAYLGDVVFDFMTLYFEDRPAFEAATRGLAPEMRSYLSSLGAGERVRTRELARQIDFWTTAPFDNK